MIIDISQGTARLPRWRLGAPVDFQLSEGEHIAIVGDNGAGKTLLADMLTSRHPLLPRKSSPGPLVPGDLANPKYGFMGTIAKNIKYISFRDAYGGDIDRAYYLQQRWHQFDIDEETPTARAKLDAAFLLAGDDTPERRTWQKHIYDLFGMGAFLDKYIVLLSSGELRKFRLAEALFSEPRVLIMDNPFIGLDAPTRVQLEVLLTDLSQEKTMQIVLILSRPDEVPAFITHVVEVKDKIVLPKCALSEFMSVLVPEHVLSEEARQAIMNLPNEDAPSGEVVRLKKVSIVYGEHTLLKDLSWTVKTGEKWLLTGRNGSGKSTLLSLVCADNPQSYACYIELFGRRRGSGESIWDIKKHIGYVSPEMHRAYRENVPALRIVASGTSDFAGLYKKISAEETEKCRFWMKIFGVEALADRPFLSLSDGEQRLLLVARAFVKDPSLLVLDEPLHGLDNCRRRLVLDIIDSFCSRPSKTLVMVTHYEDEVPSCITHRIVLQRP